jgi:GrpB-like predicted nucleotidyltransferase (UPF0157 family)
MFVTQYADNSFALRNLTVQDHLRNHPRERLHIADLKKGLAEQLPQETERNVDGKTEFLRRAKATKAITPLRMR